MYFGNPKNASQSIDQCESQVIEEQATKIETLTRQLDSIEKSGHNQFSLKHIHFHDEFRATVLAIHTIYKELLSEQEIFDKEGG